MPSFATVAKFTRGTQLFIVDLSLTLLGLACLAGGLYYIYVDHAAMTATCMASGLILLFASTLHRFELLKGFGVEAKMKKLDATIDKAELALSQLANLTEVTTGAIIDLSCKMGRWSSAPTVDEARALAETVRRTLSMSGADESKILKILAPWAKIEIQDLAHAAMKPYKKACEDLNSVLRSQANKIKQPIKAEDQPEFNSLHQRINHVSDHMRELSELVSERPLVQVPAFLISHIQNAPELDPLVKSNLIADLAPFNSEIEHMATKIEFKDIDFWRRHVRTER